MAGVATENMKLTRQQGWQGAVSFPFPSDVGLGGGASDNLNPVGASNASVL